MGQFAHPRSANGVALLTRVCSPDPVTDIHTERLILHPIDTDEAERIVARQPGASDLWARDFPFEGDVVGVTMFLRATTGNGDQYPFGHYVIVRAGDGQAVGGIGFKGQPEDGTAEIGYGLTASARGNGYAAEAGEHSSNLLASRGYPASSLTRTRTTLPPSGPSSTRGSRRSA